MIDENKLLAEMDLRYKEKVGKVPDNMAEGFVQMEKLIKEQPNFNIVRCNDCKHFRIWGGLNPCTTCSFWTVDYDVPVGHDDFCSYGELKE